MEKEPRMSDNPYILSDLPPLDYSDGAIQGFDINTPISEKREFTSEELDCLWTGPVLSVASILIRLHGGK
jgi:hypothetical protein